HDSIHDSCGFREGDNHTQGRRAAAARPPDGRNAAVREPPARRPCTEVRSLQGGGSDFRYNTSSAAEGGPGTVSKPLFFYSDDMMQYDMGPQHPMQPRRLRMTYDLLDSYGVFEDALPVVPPSLAPYEDVAAVHSRDFLEALSRLDSGDTFPGAHRYGFGTG